MTACRDNNTVSNSYHIPKITAFELENARAKVTGRRIPYPPSQATVDGPVTYSGAVAKAERESVQSSARIGQGRVTELAKREPAVPSIASNLGQTQSLHEVAVREPAVAGSSNHLAQTRGFNQAVVREPSIAGSSKHLAQPQGFANTIREPAVPRGSKHLDQASVFDAAFREPAVPRGFKPLGQTAGFDTTIPQHPAVRLGQPIQNNLVNAFSGLTVRDAPRSVSHCNRSSILQ